jgi:hypothetical protein
MDSVTNVNTEGKDGDDCGDGGEVKEDRLEGLEGIVMADKGGEDEEAVGIGDEAQWGRAFEREVQGA